MLYSDIIKNRYNMKIYLLKIWQYDPSSFDLNNVTCLAFKSRDLAEREMVKHNFEIAIENGDVDENEGYDNWEMIDYDSTSYEIEELEIIED